MLRELVQFKGNIVMLSSPKLLTYAYRLRSVDLTIFRVLGISTPFEYIIMIGISNFRLSVTKIISTREFKAGTDIPAQKINKLTGHFRISLNLFLKAGLSAYPFI